MMKHADICNMLGLSPRRVYEIAESEGWKYRRGPYGDGRLWFIEPEDVVAFSNRVKENPKARRERERTVLENLNNLFSMWDSAIRGVAYPVNEAEVLTRFKLCRFEVSYSVYGFSGELGEKRIAYNKRKKLLKRY